MKNKSQRKLDTLDTISNITSRYRDKGYNIIYIKSGKASKES